MSKKDVQAKQSAIPDYRTDTIRPPTESPFGSANNSSTSLKKNGSRNRNKTLHGSKRNVAPFNPSINRTNIVDDSDDIVNILKTAKKGTNISHLLTYNYTDDDTVDQKYEQNPKPNYSKNHRRKQHHTEIRLHGLSYINANYKFILNADGNYKSQLIDPNLPFDVKDVHRVVVKQHDYHCPICMGDEFVAPRMTKCGHIFCYPCLTNMFENVRNDKTKTNLGNQHNPLISCPLCSEVIREKFPLFPVLMDQVKDDENKIELMSYRTVSLMYRSSSRIYSQAISNFYQFKGFNGSIPWIGHGCTPLDYKKYSPYVKNSRLILSDNDFAIACYEKEVDDILTQKLLDFEVYGDPGIYYDIVLDKINSEIESLKNRKNEQAVKGPQKFDPSSLDINSMSLSESREVRLPSFKDGYYFYQCDINSRIHYYLSPLDVKIINQLFNVPDVSKVHPDTIDGNIAYNFPLSLFLYVENINFEEGKVTPELVNKNPYLSNLPYGSEVGFLEVDWSKFDASFISADNSMESDNREKNYPPQIPYFLRKQLQTRTKNIKKKRHTEENARVRGELRREKETMEIFTKDDNAVEYPESDEDRYYHSNKWNKNKFVHINDFESMPILNSSSGLLSLNNSETQLNTFSNNNDGKGMSNFTTRASVWGTMVPVVIDSEEEALRAEESRKIQEMIDKAKSEAASSDNGKRGKKGRKAKLVYLPL